MNGIIGAAILIALFGSWIMFWRMGVAEGYLAGLRDGRAEHGDT
jgi:hypothetical protein